MENEAQIASEIGKRIALERKQKQLTQKQLAAGICSQSMLSSIEKGLYVPNAVLLAQICQKLAISMDTMVLSHYLEINQQTEFNQKIKALCDQHDYVGMLAYLDDSQIIDQLHEDQDLQTYYYYYGVATFQVSHDVIAGLRYLNMAYDYTVSRNAQPVTSTELLISAVVAFLKTETKQLDDGFGQFQNTLKLIQSHFASQYDENLNIAFYLNGLAYLRTGKYVDATTVVNAGIDWTTAHHSTYMLSDLFFILAKAYTATLKENEASEALAKSQTIASIYHVETYKHL